MPIIHIEIPQEMLNQSESKICINLHANTVYDTLPPHNVINVLPSSPVKQPSQRQIPTFCHFIEELLIHFRHTRQERLIETYNSARNSFLLFLGKSDIAFSDFQPTLLSDYEQWLKHRNLCLNTISFYMRILRAIYYRAVTAYHFVDVKPFCNVFTGNERTAKRAISLSEIHRLAHLHLSHHNEQFARDMFLFSFYTRGMSFVDMAHLLRSDLNNNYLVYKRRKTGQQLRIAWQKEIHEIVLRWAALDNIHLLGILDTNDPRSIRQQLHSRQTSINNTLKRIGMNCGLKGPLTLYVARHTWATAARDMDVPVSIISEALGHNSERTTQVYLNSINEQRIHESNKLLIQAVGY